MRQIIIFAVPQGHTQEEVITNPALLEFPNQMMGQYDAKWPGQVSAGAENFPDWWMPGFSRKVAGKTAVQMNVSAVATVANITALMASTPINWMILGMYDRHMTQGEGDSLIQGVKKALEKGEMLSYKNDIIDVEGNVSRPTELGNLHQWYGDKLTDGDTDLDTELDPG